MKCPKCKVRMFTCDTRPIEFGATIRRRYECPKCKERFTSYENYDHRPETTATQ